MRPHWEYFRYKLWPEFISTGPGYFDPDDVYINLRRSKGIFDSITAGSTERIDDSVNEVDRIFKQWASFTETASRTCLTFSSDKLPSLSGIVSLLQPSLQTRYIAGHWESNLLQSLIWCCDAGEDEIAGGGYVAPSWSWASAPRAVRRWDLNSGNAPCTILSTILSIHVTHTGTDKFGAVQDGHLRIRGTQLVGTVNHTRMEVDHYLGDFELPWGVSERIPIQVFPDKRYWSQVEGIPDTSPRTLSFSSTTSIRLLLLFTDQHHRAHGLMLRQLDDRSGGGFKRIGYFVSRVHRRHDFEALLRKFGRTATDLLTEDFTIF